MYAFSSGLFAVLYLMVAAVVCGIQEIDVSLCLVSGDSVLYSISFFLLFLFLIFDTFVHVFFLYKNEIF